MVSDEALDAGLAKLALAASRAGRGLVLGLVVVLLGWSQTYFVFPVWTVALAVAIIATLSITARVAIYAVGFLLALTLFPPQFVQAIAGWIRSFA